MPTKITSIKIRKTQAENRDGFIGNESKLMLPKSWTHVVTVTGILFSDSGAQLSKHKQSCILHISDGGSTVSGQ